MGHSLRMLILILPKYLHAFPSVKEKRKFKSKHKRLHHKTSHHIIITKNTSTISENGNVKVYRGFVVSGEILFPNCGDFSEKCDLYS